MDASIDEWSPEDQVDIRSSSASENAAQSGLCFTLNSTNITNHYVNRLLTFFVGTMQRCFVMAFD